MKRLVKRFWGVEALRYLFFGGCTTGVNVLVFTILRYMWNASVYTANFISIIVSVLFAFFVNRWMVFQKGKEDTGKIIQEFANFAGMRLGTLGIEFFGVIALVRWTGMSDFLSKLMIQLVVIILNYMISKFFIFGDSQVGGMTNE